MNALLLPVALLLLQLGAMSATAAGMERHRDQFRPAASRLHPALLRAGGATLHAVSLGVAAHAYGWATGAVVWFGAATFVALAVALLLSYAQPRLRNAVMLATPAGLLVLGLSASMPT